MAVEHNGVEEPPTGTFPGYFEKIDYIDEDAVCPFCGYEFTGRVFVYPETESVSFRCPRCRKRFEVMCDPEKFSSPSSYHPDPITRSGKSSSSPSIEDSVGLEEEKEDYGKKIKEEDMEEDMVCSYCGKRLKSSHGRRIHEKSCPFRQ